MSKLKTLKAFHPYLAQVATNDVGKLAGLQCKRHLQPISSCMRCMGLSHVADVSPSLFAHPLMCKDSSQLRARFDKEPLFAATYG